MLFAALDTQKSNLENQRKDEWGVESKLDHLDDSTVLLRSKPR